MDFNTYNKSETLKGYKMAQTLVAEVQQKGNGGGFKATK